MLDRYLFYNPVSVSNSKLNIKRRNISVIASSLRVWNFRIELLKSYITVASARRLSLVAVGNAYVRYLSTLKHFVVRAANCKEDLSDGFKSERNFDNLIGSCHRNRNFNKVGFKH